jgi:hypothetical protein
MSEGDSWAFAAYHHPGGSSRAAMPALGTIIVAWRAALSADGTFGSHAVDAFPTLARLVGVTGLAEASLRSAAAGHQNDK